MNNIPMRSMLVAILIYAITTISSAQAQTIPLPKNFRFAGDPIEEPVFESTARLSKYAQDTILCSLASAAGDTGIIEGPNLDANRAAITENLSCIQPAVYPAWGGFWPASKPNSITDYSFATQPLDVVVNWGVQNNLKIIHHMLLGPNLYFPEWFWRTDYSVSELDDLLRTYIERVILANDNSKKVYAWNLINEIITTDGRYYSDGTGASNNKWIAMGMEPDESGLTGASQINTQHPIFVRKAFEYAAAVTSQKLEIREAHVEFSHITPTMPNKRMLALYQLVKHLKNKGVRVDAVGFQAHFNYATNDYHEPYDWADFKRTIEKFRNAGVDVYLTELDVGLRWDETVEVNGVRVPKDDVDWEVVNRERPKVYYNAIKVAREAGVALISTWGLADGTTGSWRKDQKALILDSAYERKEEYQSFLRALFETQ